MGYSNDERTYPLTTPRPSVDQLRVRSQTRRTTIRRLLTEQAMTAGITCP